MAVTRDALRDAFAQLLNPSAFKDYGPNGLQVEGKPTIQHLVSGVTASQALIDAAVATRADAIVVHHGLFWRGMDGTLTGWMRQRVRTLLLNDINLFAYHLPLDAHVQLGNNAQLGIRLGFGAGQALAAEPLIFEARVDFAYADALAQHIQHVLGRAVICIDGGKPIKRVAWCTGGAQSYFQKAIDAGIDAFITGEMSEPQAHLARECGVSFIAAGHHATERYGVQALAEQVAAQLGITHQFIEIDNPA